jgi:hypothetical protein
MKRDPALRARESGMRSRWIFKILKDWRVFVLDHSEDRIKAFDSAWPRWLLQKLGRRICLL